MTNKHANLELALGMYCKLVASVDQIPYSCQSIMSMVCVQPDLQRVQELKMITSSPSHRNPTLKEIQKIQRRHFQPPENASCLT